MFDFQVFRRAEAKTFPVDRKGKSLCQMLMFVECWFVNLLCDIEIKSEGNLKDLPKCLLFLILLM